MCSFRNQLLCATCGKVFSKPALLRRHEAVHTPEKQYKCCDCNQSFTQNSSLQRHIKQKHHGVKRYKCTACQRSFGQHSNLKQHIKLTHNNKLYTYDVYPCDLCACVFQKAGALKRHQTIFHKLNTNKTIDQDDKLTLPDDPDLLAQNVLAQLKHLQNDLNNQQKDACPENSLAETKIIDNMPPPTTVTLIEEPQAQIVTLKDRLNPQNDTKLFSVLSICRNKCKYYVCEFCAMEFHKSYDLIRHRRSHTQETPYECNICSMCFCTRTKLNEHSKKHILDEETGLISHQHTCGICEQSFDSIRKLDQHVRIHAADYDVEYSCAHCSAKFASAKSFAAHKHCKVDKELKMLEKLLPEPIYLCDNNDNEILKQQTFKCSTCKKNLINEVELKEHNDRHKLLRRYECESCGRFYVTKSALNWHKKIHNNHKSFSCTICPNKYFLSKMQLEQHLQHIHNTTRNFKCVYCDAKFKTKAHCKSHMKTHLKKLLNISKECTIKASKNIDNFDNPQVNTNSEDYLLKSQKGHQIITATNSNEEPKLIELQLFPNYTKPKPTYCNITVEAGDNKKQMQESKNVVKYKCRFCSKSFKKPSDLERHLRTHTLEKPFLCNSCGKSFALKSTLSEHQLTHDTHRKPNICQVCGKDYAYKKTLAIHLRLHTNARPFHCDWCDKTFRTSGHRLAHLKAKNLCNGNRAVDRSLKGAT